MTKSKGVRSRLAFWSGVCFVILGIIVLTARILFVRWGILYGASPVSQVDALVAALITLGVICFVRRRKRPEKASETGDVGRPAEEGNGKGSAQSWTDWASRITALVGAATLVASLLNLIEPLNPPNLARPACPGARDAGVPYVGITSGLNGDNSRRGAGQSYLADGRFPENCSIGFSVYCLGDSIQDGTGTTNEATWVTSRWLKVAKQPKGWRSTAAHLLSGESLEPQFVSDAFITPETAYPNLHKGTSSQCPQGLPYPGKTSLKEFDRRAGTFTAKANGAPNMGFAVWVPPRQGFLDGDSYTQIQVPVTDPDDNPGETSPDGGKSAEWGYASTLLPQFQPPPGKAGVALGHVVILAIPCLADNIPAPLSTAAVAGYRLSKNGPPVATVRPLGGFDKNRLALAACEANT